MRAAQDGRIGALLLLDLPCVAHILNTISGKAFAKPRLLPKLHSVAFTFNDAARFPTVQLGLAKVVSQDLARGVGWFPGQYPPNEYRQHNAEIISGTLLRHLHTRGIHIPEMLGLAIDCDGGCNHYYCMAHGSGLWVGAIVRDIDTHHKQPLAAGSHRHPFKLRGSSSSGHLASFI